MVYDVFISHSSKDKTVADATCAWLEAHGIRCWIAPRDIQPGANWGSSIIKAIHGARVMVLLLSSHANASPQIKREVERAVNAGAIIIPMRIEDVLPQDDLEYFLGTPHWLDAFTPPLELHLNKLAAAINEILEIPAPASSGRVPEDVPETMAEPEPVPRFTIETPLPKPPPHRPWGKGWLISLSVAVVVLALVGLGYYFGVATPTEKVRRAEIAQQEAQAKVAAAEAEKQKADAAAAQAKSEEEKAALEKAKQDAEARTVAAQQAAQQARAEVDKAKQAEQAAATPPAPQPTASASGPVLGQLWENSLWMKFNPVPGVNALFGVWDVRVKDYAAFVKETGRDWPKPEFTQTENDPAVMVSWDDAHAFCDWLTKKEQAEGRLASNQEYRLPTDAEWSKAVGLNESSEGTPAEKSGKIKGVYPWGTQWPPPQGAGNYPESLTHDGYANTSPVGSFAANQYGLYDMGGNVWQWCEDKYNSTTRVLRGASWYIGGSGSLLSSFRSGAYPGGRSGSLGFRVVVVVSPYPPVATTPPVTPSPTVSAPVIGPVLGQPWENSLGMKFNPVPGVNALFGVWDVRVKDYAAFVKETGRDWPKPEFTQTENDPAVKVSWDDAHAFCDWLTKKEQAEGKLGPNQSYRLPRDAEWSVAVGLGDEGAGTPKDKDQKIKGVYPWGTQWPPPVGAGNYCGEETKSKHPSWTVITGYNDGYAETSPVRSFKANKYGLYDMGGNVWQWCEDKYDPTQEYRLLRGASWYHDELQGLLSSYRFRNIPGNRRANFGFRVVVEVSP